MARTLRLTLLTLWLVNSQAQGSVDVSATGSIGRGHIESFILNVTLKGVPPTEITSSNAKARLAEALTITLTNHTSTASILIPGSKATNPLPGVEATYSVEPFVEFVSKDQNTVTFSFNISDRGSDPSFDKMVADNKHLSIQVNYVELIGGQQRDVKVDIVQDTAIIKDAPGDVTAISIHKSIKFAWLFPESVTLSDGKTKKPTALNLYVIEMGDTVSLDLPAKTLRDKPEDEVVDGHCTLTFQPTTKTCAVAACVGKDGKLAYLDSAGLAASPPSVPLFQVRRGLSGDSQVVSDLVKKHQYVAFTQFAPDGVGISNCTVAEATENISLTELNGGPEARTSDPRCFIATAAFGSSMGPELDRLRWFRDTFLMPYHLGRQLTDSYYNHSPIIADFIKEHSLYRTIVRTLLWPIIGYIAALQAHLVLTSSITAAVFLWGLMRFLLL